MTVGISRIERLLETPLERGPRLLLLVAVFLLGASFAAPLWKVAVAPGSGDASVTYSLGLTGSEPSMVAVGSASPVGAIASNERGWIALGLVALALLFARAAALGTLRSLVDTVVLYLLFGAAALKLLAQELGRLGGAPSGADRASMGGLLFGQWRSSGVHFAAFPSVGAWTIALAGIVVAAAFLAAWRSSRRELEAEFAVAG